MKAFCGISTGIYGYPLYPASEVALETIRRWLDKDDNRTKFDRIIFCVFLAKELDCYEYLMPAYFPKEGTPFTPLPVRPEDEEEPVVSESESEEEEAAASSSSSSDEEDENEANQNVPGIADNPTAAALAQSNPGMALGEAGTAGALVGAAMDAEDAKAKVLEAGLESLSNAAGGLIRDVAEAEAAKAEAAGITAELEEPVNSAVDTTQLPMEERKTSE